MQKYLDNSNKKIKFAIQFVSGYGGEFHSWRFPNANAKAYTDIEHYIRLAQIAEKGKIQTLFIADTPSLGGAGGGGDLARRSPMFPMEPMTILSAVAVHTKKIGLTATFSTTYNLPYNLARQLKTLDMISDGRVGWNAVTTSTPHSAYNFGNQPLPSTEEKYERADEMVRAVQSLWGSWGENAYIANKETGEFADMSKIKPINFNGKYYQTKGPLLIPPTPQGQPPIFQAGGGQNGVELAGKFASGMYANPFTIEEAIAHRTRLKKSALEHGRNPNEINMFSGFMFSIADTKEEALAWRRQLLDYMGDELDGYVYHLGLMLGLDLRGADIDTPFSEKIRNWVEPNPYDPRSIRAVELVKEGYSIKDVLAHGVINYHPVVVGTAVEVADFLEKWFRAGATDGFSLAPNSPQGVERFVEEVIPVLQERGLFHLDYEGDTLREHLGVSYQYGEREK